MRILFALPGFHRYNRGAETALIAIASELVRSGDTVTLIGSGKGGAATPYRFLRARSVARENFESFPSVPILRNDCAYEELTFIPDFLRNYRPADFDVTLTCSYPFTNWALRRPTLRGSRPPHVFVTENGDWPAVARESEYRFFWCEGLVCTNPDFYDRNKGRWFCKLIPNGVDCDRFRPGPAQREDFRLPRDRFIVLMVSALVSSKRVELGIESVSRIPDAHLVIAGDGPLRQTIDTKAGQMLPGRFTRLTVAPDRMPALYQSANVFLHLSKEESFGNVFLEAMACGLPIVATDAARVQWIVGNGEFLLGVDEPVQIARQIEIARAAPTALEGERLKRAGEFSWTKIAGMYREFLSEIVSANNKKYRKLQ
jgi:glycosyltransferase involved in cell wall biosynthesis